MEETNTNKTMRDTVTRIGLIICIIVITTWITYDRVGFLGTIPLIIIIPFFLRLFFAGGLVMVVTAFITSLLAAFIKDDLGNGILFIPGILIAVFSGALLAKGITNKDKSKHRIFIGIGVLAVIFAGMNYAEIWGDPISYLKAKSNIQTYINENYGGRLAIKEMRRSFLKMNGYYADVVQKEDTRNKSTIYYGDRGYISDRYYDETTENMNKQVSEALISLIENQTDLTYYDIHLIVNAEIPLAKYDLDDRFLGHEAISVDIQLQPDYSWKQKDSEQTEVRVYSSKEAFAEDAYKIITVLQNSKYQYKEVEIYYYLEDGNTIYEILLKDGESIHSLGQVIERVQMANHSK